MEKYICHKPVDQVHRTALTACSPGINTICNNYAVIAAMVSADDYSVNKTSKGVALALRFIHREKSCIVENVPMQDSIGLENTISSYHNYLIYK